jgi:hypothetical protein
LNCFGDSWKYLNCHTVAFLVDGTPFSMGKSSYDSRMSGAYTSEYLEWDVAFAKIEALARAKSIEYKVCNDEYSVNPSQMPDIRSFVEVVRRESGAPRP